MSTERQCWGNRLAELFTLILGFLVVVIIIVVIGVFEFADWLGKAFSRERRETDRLLAEAEYEETGSLF